MIREGVERLAWERPNEGKKRVAVLLSGGVDSAVALHLLLQRGFDVVAYHMKTAGDEFYISKQVKHKVCCSPSDTHDAQQIANKFGVPFKLVHVEELFEKLIVDYFINENLRGRTPNPCFFCNDIVKFGYLMELALSEGADFVASGHYARIKDGRLLRAIDPSKDQSYFLAAVRPEKLRRIILPNGDYTKDEIRKIAEDVGIHVARKPDSQDLCFLPDNDLKAFFAERGIEVRGGNIIDDEGRIIGRHDGLPFYTIGQRKLGLAAGRKLYVRSKNVEGNFIVVAPVERLHSKTMRVKLVNAYIELPATFAATVKVRKKFKEVGCRVVVKGEELIVDFEEPVFAVTPGQIAVFYDGDYVICSGVIEG